MFCSLFVLLSVISLSSQLTCYDCFNTGPDHKECTKERTCKGIACMIFDAGDNRTSTAFCLLAMKSEDNLEEKNGCWLEPDGRGKHCMCNTDYCNKLVDRRGAVEDPLSPILPHALFLKQNPLVDYPDHINGESEETGGSHPMPENLLFPASDKVDPKIAGHNSQDEDDLVPVEFEEYDRSTKDDENTLDSSIEQKKPAERTSSEDKSVSSSRRPPSLVLMFMTMAASWAQLLVFL